MIKWYVHCILMGWLWSATLLNLYISAFQNPKMESSFSSGFANVGQNKHPHFSELVSGNTPIQNKNETVNADTALVKNLGAAINSPYADYFPSISHDDQILIFTQRFKSIEEEFYIAYKDSCGSWETAINMGHPPNSIKNEASQTMSLDRKYLFFTRCGIVSDNGWAEGGCDLYFSHPLEGKWVSPVPFGGTINTPAYEGMPSICPDNHVLYFVSNRNGGYGGYDIWSVSFRDGQWQIPVNLGPTINTKYDEISPFIASDDKTLYFSSQRNNGVGGMDIFVSNRTDKDSTWGKPTLLPIPINSSADDISPHLLSSGDKLYFSSNRKGGWGDFDLYETILPSSFQPHPMSLIQGYAVDNIKGDTITNVKLMIIDDETIIKEMNSNKGDGSFFFALSPYKVYIIKARRYDYPEITFEYKINAHQTATPIELIIPLEYYIERALYQRINDTSVNMIDTMRMMRQ